MKSFGLFSEAVSFAQRCFLLRARREVQKGTKTAAVRPRFLSIRAIGNGTSAVLTKDENAAVIGSSGNIEYKSIHGLYAASASRVSVLSAENESAESSAGNQGTESVTESPVVFEGNGYGHGIGMPQDSAIEMAKQGFTFREILEYYYTDIEIR